MPYKDKEKAKAYRERNKEKSAGRQRAYYKENKESILEKVKKFREDNKDLYRKWQKKYYRTVKGRFKATIKAAEKRDKTFTLTFEEFARIIDLPCYYCANELYYPNETGSGLDRVDNSIGYEINNVVSCCKVCNSIKGEFLTSEETKIAVRAILKLRKQKLFSVDP